MVKTTEELVKTFNATCGFTCSDEITLLFPIDETVTNEERVAHGVPYNGKIQKLVSLSAGLASSLFLQYIREETYDPVAEQRLHEHVYGTLPYFDSRVCPVPRNVELINNVMWRSSYDYRRNSISGLAQAHFSQKQLNSKNTKEQIVMLEEKGVHWSECPDWYKYGTIIKKERLLKETEVKGEMITALRSRISSRSFEIERNFEQAQAELLLAKHWPDTSDVVEYLLNNKTESDL